MEACREHIGEHPCDRRRPISEQRRDFPGVDFSLVRSLLNIFEDQKKQSYEGTLLDLRTGIHFR